MNARPTTTETSSRAGMLEGCFDQHGEELDTVVGGVWPTEGDEEETRDRIGMIEDAWEASANVDEAEASEEVG